MLPNLAGTPAFVNGVVIDVLDSVAFCNAYLRDNKKTMYPKYGIYTADAWRNVTADMEGHSGPLSSWEFDAIFLSGILGISTALLSVVLYTFSRPLVSDKAEKAR